MISNKMKHIWPPKSPDMSPLDYWFWGACEQHIKKSKPLNIDELVDLVSDYARNIPRQVVFKAVRIFISGLVAACWIMVEDLLRIS